MYRLFFILLLSAISFACQQQAETFQAQIRPLTEAVYASGFVMPQDEYQVFALSDGYLTERLVEEGDTVTVGSLMFKIKSDQQQARLKVATESYAIAKQNAAPLSQVIQEMETALKSAELNMANDSANWVRYQRLWQQQATSLQQYERAKLAYETSKNQYLMQANRLAQTKQNLQLALQDAASQQVIAAAEQDNYLISSHIQGRVFEIYKEAGEAVRRNEVLALLGSANQMYLRLSVDEQDIRKVALGQRVLVKVDMYESEVFEATITRIYPMLNRQEQAFRVDAHFVGDYPHALTGLNAEANIIIQEKKETLTIPKKLLDGEDSVWTLQNKEKVKVRIEKGVQNLELVEVLAGIDTTTQLLMP